MRLETGDHVTITYEAEVITVHRRGGEIVGYELALAGADPDDPLLVPVEALRSRTGPTVRRVTHG